MPIELSIQQSTTVKILGPISAARDAALPMAPSVELSDAGTMLGQLQITAFIRHPIQRQIISNFTSASGAITDGMYHVCVDVAVSSVQMIPAGTHVSILGELRRNNYDTLILQVTEMSNIQIVDEQMMDSAQLRNGFHIVPKIAAGKQVPPIPNVAPQMQVIAQRRQLLILPTLFRFMQQQCQYRQLHNCMLTQIMHQHYWQQMPVRNIIINHHHLVINCSILMINNINLIWIFHL
ncbi:uncharacterized protein LOC122849079 [Aphidius gifuensis]|nr:uncharacterized protein LOC122849079 [Aphidius gifuensis]XP_044003578.1 uncharacterized protein LOC122849079 [Aphidius gifuensis]